MIPPPEGLTPDDYHLIEDAVMETARGRWFLAEFARRVRAGDTKKILDAIERLERASGPSQFAAAQDHARGIGERLFDVAFQLRARGVEEALCRVVEREGSAAYALAGEERGPAFSREFETPEPQPRAIGAPARRSVLQDVAGNAPKTVEAVGETIDVAPAPSEPFENDAALRLAASRVLDEIARMTPLRRLGHFS